MRVNRTILKIIKVPIQPAIAAPSIRISEVLLPVSINANAIPGSAACEIASPRRLCRLKTA